MPDRLQLLRNSGRFLILCSILSFIAILFIDKPLALFIHANQLDSSLIFLRKITEGLPWLLTFIVIIGLCYRYWTQKIIWGLILAIYFYACLQITMKLKNGFKIIFGRYWPKTWINNNLSLIHDGVFGFDWGHGFANQGSFPSGHSAYTAFCICWLIYFIPKLRSLWLFLLILMPACLILLDYHFLGDCLLGLGLGYFCAALSIVFVQYSIKTAGCLNLS